MFSRLGSFAVRFRWYIIAAWAVAAVVLTLVAPNIDDVAVTDQRAFLSQDVPSLQANELLKKYFPDQVALSSAVLVVDAGAGGDVTTGAAAGFVDGLTSWLTSGGAPAAVDDVWSPTHGDELTRAGMTSDDKQVAMILVRFNAVATEPITQDALTAIRARLDGPPAGLQAYLTGDGAILDAYSTASLKSMDSVTIITIVLVLVISAPDLPVAGEPLHPPGHHRPLLPDLPWGHRLPGVRSAHHLHVHQRLSHRGAVRSRHRLLPVPDQPLPRRDGRRQPGRPGGEDHRARRRRDHRLERRHGDRGPGHDGLRRAGPVQHHRSRHSHRRRHHPAGRPHPHPRPARRPRPPRLLAAQGRAHGRPGPVACLGRRRWSSIP